MRAGHFHFQTTRGGVGRREGERVGLDGDADGQGLARSARAGLFSFLHAASLESRINHARSPGAFEPPCFTVSTATTIATPPSSTLDPKPRAPTPSDRRSRSLSMARCG